MVRIVKKAKTLSEIIKHFELDNKGGNHKTLKKRLYAEDIDFSHIPLGLSANKGVKFNKAKIPLQNITVVNSTYDRGHLKKRLLSEGLLLEKCAICGIGNEWNKRKLTLQLDHINGISSDCRIKNLRLLCPNCHSQTHTFCGKKTRTHIN